MTKKQLLLGFAVAAVAAALVLRWYLRKNAGALAVGMIAAAIDKGPKKADVSRAATGEGKELEDAFIANHKALMDGDWDEFKKWTKADNVKQMEAAGGAKALPLIRAMTPAQIAVKGASASGSAGSVSVEGEVFGKKSYGKISLVQEDGRWKVAGMSWADSPATAARAATETSAAAPSVVSASPPGATDMDVNFFNQTSNFKGKITLNGSQPCVFGDKGSLYQFGCPAFFDKVRYGENVVDLEYASLGDKTLPHKLEIKVSRYDRQAKAARDLKTWTFSSPAGGKERLTFVHAKDGVAPAAPASQDSAPQDSAPQAPAPHDPAPPDSIPDVGALRADCPNEASLFCPGLEAAALAGCLNEHAEDLLKPCKAALKKPILPR